MPERMSALEIESALESLSGWSAEDDSALLRAFRFADHIDAMGFIVRVSMAAEAMNHHPDVHIVYNNVNIRLSSHDAGGITDRDVRLARRISELLG